MVADAASSIMSGICAFVRADARLPARASNRLTSADSTRAPLGLGLVRRAVTAAFAADEARPGKLALQAQAVTGEPTVKAVVRHPATVARTYRSLLRDRGHRARPATTCARCCFGDFGRHGGSCPGAELAWRPCLFPRGHDGVILSLWNQKLAHLVSALAPPTASARPTPVDVVATAAVPRGRMLAVRRTASSGGASARPSSPVIRLAACACAAGVTAGSSIDEPATGL